MDLVIGIDIGTSGIRAVCADLNLATHAMASIRFDELRGHRTDPATWATAVTKVLSALLVAVPIERLKAVAVDGTSGTMIVTDEIARPLSKAMMYSDVCDDLDVLSRIKKYAPDTSAAHGASSGLAKAIILSRTDCAAMIQHEADWIASGLSGKSGLSDENNSLKTGYDPITQTWPDWIEKTGLDRSLLPKVLRAGQPIGMANGWLAKQSGLPSSVLVVAGTTDGCASFLATGASDSGDGVTVLGSTLTIKLLSETPIYSPEFGIYSHRIGDIWLAGGASNSGGKVLEHYFSVQKLNELSEQMDAQSLTGLNYYPLLTPGERFPLNDNTLQPILEPRPVSDVLFLQGMLEGISTIEKLAYTRLSELGGTAPQSIRTLGGGAKNRAWTKIRKSKLKSVGFHNSISEHAATGAAMLARMGALEAGLVN